MPLVVAYKMSVKERRVAYKRITGRECKSGKMDYLFATITGTRPCDYKPARSRRKRARSEEF